MSGFSITSEPAFRLMVLGASGAGKTIFLAALYKKLLIPTKDNPISIKPILSAHQEHLLNTFGILECPGDEWPPFTFGVTEYEFECFYHNLERNIKTSIFRFTYLDFPGGNIHQQVDEKFDIRQATQQAASIVVLIDGAKIRSSILGSKHGGKTLNQDLTAIASILMSGMPKPVQFVVTKWDLLEDIGLARVRAELAKSKSFNDLVASYRHQAFPLHLIPVSAVGSDFAIFDTFSGESIRKSGSVANPHNVEFSISFAISDQVQLLAAAKGDLLQKYGYFLYSMVYLFHIALYGSLAAEHFLGPIFKYYSPVPIPMRNISRTLRELERKTSLGEKALKAKIDLARRDLVERRNAFEAIALLQSIMASQFVQAYPDADMKVI
jgi:hypothetical protein